jgi:acetylornithine deacetylase/succinyl-diaminopimelate desuccinylase-like protein
MTLAILDHIDTHRDEVISLLREMIRIPSPTFEEGKLAEFTRARLEQTGMDAYINRLGDVTGVARGSSSEPLFLLNTHLDQSAAGDMDDPFEGKLIDGAPFGVDGPVLYGRGANGQKACLAGMIFACQAVLAAKVPLRRGVAVNAGVMEECGGHLSPRYLMDIDRLPIGPVLCGEHTALRPVNRQRGMVHVQLHIQGRGGHAAAPEGSSSALSGMARVIIALEGHREAWPKDPMLGAACVSLNKIHVVPNVANVIPDACHAVVDIRHPVTMKREEIVGQVQRHIAAAVGQQPGLRHVAEVERRPVVSYTGQEELSDGCMFPFYTPEEDPLVVALQESIHQVSGKARGTELWSISSEAGYFSTVSGLPVVCFGPGEDRFTHNQVEHVRLEDVITATKVFALMVLKLCT